MWMVFWEKIISTMKTRQRTIQEELHLETERGSQGRTRYQAPSRDIDSFGV